MACGPTLRCERAIMCRAVTLRRLGAGKIADHGLARIAALRARVMPIVVL